MAEMIKSKTLKTILRLKYDTLANWKAAEEYVPMKGEVCIVSVPADTQQVAPEPAILFKVGDGVGVVFKKEGSSKTELPWASGLAADVYGWAKESSLTVTKNGTGNVVASISWDATLNNGKGGIKYETAAVATAEGLDQIQKDLSALTDTVNAMYTNDQIDTAIATAKSGAETTAANALSTARTEISAEIDADVKVVADDLAEYKTAVDGALTARYTKEEANAKFALISDAYDDTALAGRVSTLETNSATKTELTDGLATKADKTAFETIKTKVDNFFAEDAAVNDVIDTLVEITNYIANDKEGAANISAKLGALEGKVDVAKVSEAITTAVKNETDRATAAEGELEGRIESLENAGYATTGEVATAKSEAISTAAEDATTKAGTAESNAKAYTDTEIGKVNTEVAKKANDADLKTIAKTGNVNDLVQTEGDVLVLFGGNATGWTE